MSTKEQTPSLGIILIALGALFLLANTGLLGALSRLFWSVLFLGGGASFLGLYFRDKEKWWALIPGFSLLALGAAVTAGNLSGSVFLGLIGTGFAAVYFSDKRRWWAIIPAGLLFTLALVAGAGSLFPRWDAGPLLFLGFAATFTILYLLPQSEGGQRWALYPALGWIALAVLSSGFMGGIWTLIGPALLIAAGIYLFFNRQVSSTKEF